MKTVLSVVALLLSVTAASAQCGGRRVFATQSHCAAPIVQSYAAPYVAPYVAPLAYQPVALYVLPGTPTVALNLYPGQVSLVQPLLVPVAGVPQVPAAQPPAAPPVTVPPAAPPTPPAAGGGG